jgi:hypothetical protein
MLHGFRDLADDDEVSVNALLLNAFDFNAGKGEQVGELGDGQVGEIDVGGEPGETGDRIFRMDRMGEWEALVAEGGFLLDRMTGFSGWTGWGMGG